MEVGKRYVLTVESKQEIPDVEKDPAFDISSLAVKTNISDLAAEHDHYQIVIRMINYEGKKVSSKKH